MPEASGSVSRISFGPFEVDLRAAELRKHGVRIKLQAQPFRVLEMLLEHPGSLVGREELKARLWPSDSFGDFDHGLNKAINKLREALSDSAPDPQYIETVARRGYRFIAEVVAGSEAPAAVGMATDLSKSNEETTNPSVAVGLPRSGSEIFRWLIVAGLLLIAATLLILSRSRWVNSSHEIRSLAVLPFESLSNDVSQDYFADGMTDELITDLGQVSALRVISRTSVMPYKRVRKSLPQIARELGVDAVVEGTVLRVSSRVRITAQLVAAAQDKHLWARSYEGDLRDTLTLQNQVARAIAEQIRVKLTPEQKSALVSAKEVNPEAYEDYLKGRYFWNQRTREGRTKAIDYFKDAIAKDPNYAQAYAGLADASHYLGRPREAYPRSKALAEKALALDNSLSEAHTSLAICLNVFDWDWTGAEGEFKRAIELNPSYSTAHQWYAWMLTSEGRNSEAIGEMRKAEALDPLSITISSDVAETLIYARQYEEAVRQSRKTLEMDPNKEDALFTLGNAYAELRRYGDAISEYRKAVTFGPNDWGALAYFARILALTGNRTEAEKILNRLKDRSTHEYVNPAVFAVIYSGFNDTDQVLAYLAKGYEERFYPGVLMDPAFDRVRSDPRFQDLVRRTGLDKGTK
ncbi:MAG: tetratricopeptide repeat protein [Acidobacteriaceae bacterium]|nr:tetratricopeptide repeat protein [Acidobacteriaceae bacterium]MBV9766493.1 tetratricopeptide repeat protein [Acidobacteriaceae bacterium]